MFPSTGGKSEFQEAFCFPAEGTREQAAASRVKQPLSTSMYRLLLNALLSVKCDGQSAVCIPHSRQTSPQTTYTIQASWHMFTCVQEIKQGPVQTASIHSYTSSDLSTDRQTATCPECTRVTWVYLGGSCIQVMFVWQSGS